MSPLRSFALIAALCRSLLPSHPRSASRQTAQTNRTPVLVELFTSEGCSSCPPADALLAKLDQRPARHRSRDHRSGRACGLLGRPGLARPLLLAPVHRAPEPVLRRACMWTSVYTPQMIVDGTDQFVGNDARSCAPSHPACRANRQDQPDRSRSLSWTGERSPHPSPSPPPRVKPQG